MTARVDQIDKRNMGQSARLIAWKKENHSHPDPPLAAQNWTAINVSFFVLA